MVDVLRQILEELTAAEVDHMVVGSFASSVYGERRDTHDIDLVVVLTKDAVGRLADRLGAEYYCDPDAALEAVDRRDMFNIIHCQSGDKVDFWILTDDEFRRTQFARQRPVTAWGMSVFVETPEDTVLSKLVWNKISPSTGRLATSEESWRFRKTRSTTITCANGR